MARRNCETEMPAVSERDAQVSPALAVTCLEQVSAAEARMGRSVRRRVGGRWKRRIAMR